MTRTTKSIRVLMIGASGAVGKATVSALLKLKALERLTVLGRRKYDAFPSDPRATQIVIDFDNLSRDFEAQRDNLRDHNVIISSLGTTKAIAKDNATYRKIEVDYPVTFARLAKVLGAAHAVLVSSRGADRSSWFRYLAQKGEVEDAWRELSFDSLTILRPGLIGRGDDARLVEKIFTSLQKAIPCETIGSAIAHRVNDVVATGIHIKEPVILTNREIYEESRRGNGL